MRSTRTFAAPCGACWIPACAGTMRAAGTTLRKSQRSHLLRAGPRPDLVVPALDVGTRGAFPRQQQPAVDGAADHDVGGGESVVGHVAPVGELRLEERRKPLRV